MKKFQILRYLKKYRYLIVVLAFLGSFGIYKYTVQKQQYIASTVIEYTNEDAVNGKTPSGSDIDVNEIFSSNVIKAVIDDLRLSTNVDSIRSCCKVYPVIPEEETEKKKAMLEKGEDYEYFPTQYRLSFVASSSASKAYARDVLDSIISNYFSFYSRKYVEYAVVPNNVSNISTTKYDYIDCVEMLDASVTDISTYLGGKDVGYSDFRSSKTGYTFGDLKSQYDYIANSLIPKLYAMIYTNGLVRDKEGLVKRYQSRIAQESIQINNLTSQIGTLESLTGQYADKILDDVNNHRQEATSDNTVITNVEDYKQSGMDLTTYDTLINRFVTLSSNKVEYEEKLAHDNEILGIFLNDSIQETDSAKDNETVQYITNHLNETTQKLDELYELVLSTVQEFNEVVGAKNISVLTSIDASQAVNVDLYITIAVLLFLILGCCGAVFLGRLGDFVDYFMYINRLTTLPNRSKCNIVIDSLTKGLLPEEYTCISIHLVSLKTLNRGNRASGDLALKAFGAILNEMSNGFGFVGYNDGDSFIALLESCTAAKAKTFMELLQSRVDEFNGEQNKKIIEFVYGIANSSDDDLYEIRKLIGKSAQNIPQLKKDDADGK